MKLEINLNIAGIPAKLEIDSRDEELIRKAEKVINERVKKYKVEYKNEPEPAYFLALSSLLNTTMMLKLEKDLKRIEQVNRNLDEVIKI
ncbi:MAG: cell division protein ZapA [Bacilli bacterium]